MSHARIHCDIDLGIPYDPPTTPNAKLKRISHFLDLHELNDTGFNTATAAKLLENKVAKMLGAEGAIWFPTGTMAQGAAAKIYTNRRDTANNHVLLHPTSHVLLHEADGYKHLYSLAPQVEGKWAKAMDVSGLDKRPACMFIELPQRHSGGILPSWQALNDIKRRCAELGVGLHMDGARLWACRPFYENRSFEQILQGFDSAYVSFYKDIGALGGAMLLGDSTFITQAETWRTRLGGFSPGSWPMIVDTLSVIDEKLKQMPSYVKQAHLLVASIKHLDVETLPKRPHINMFHLKLPYCKDAIELAREHVAKEQGVWLSDRIWGDGEAGFCAMEFVIGEHALEVPAERFQQAINLLLSVLKTHSG